MRQLVKFFAIAVCLSQLFSGCKPVERIVEKTIIEEKIDTVERLVKVNVEVPVHLPGDTVIRMSDPIIIKDVNPLNVDPVFAFGSYAWSKAHVTNNILFNELYEMDTTIYAKYDSLVTVNDVLRTKSKTTIVENQKIITKNSNFAKFCIKWFFISIIMVILSVLFYFFNIGRR